MTVIFNDEQWQVGHGIQIFHLRQTFFLDSVGAAAISREKLCLRMGVCPCAEHFSHFLKVFSVPHIDGGAEQGIALKVHMGI